MIKPPPSYETQVRDDGFTIDKTLGVSADNISDVEVLDPTKPGQLRVRVLVERDVVEAIRRRMRRRMHAIGIYDV
jgi:hypothetical protein